MLQRQLRHTVPDTVTCPRDPEHSRGAAESPHVKQRAVAPQSDQRAAALHTTFYFSQPKPKREDPRANGLLERVFHLAKSPQCTERWYRQQSESGGFT